MKAITQNDPKRLRLEVKKQFDKYVEEKFTDMDTVILWNLHETFGFGKVKLRRYFDSYMTKVKQAQDDYGDVTYFKMREALKRIGVDVEEWEKEINV